MLKVLKGSKFDFSHQIMDSWHQKASTGICGHLHFQTFLDELVSRNNWLLRLLFWQSEVGLINKMVQFSIHCQWNPCNGPSEGTMPYYDGFLMILWQFYESFVTTLWQYCGNFVAILWQYCGNFVAILWQNCGNFVRKLWRFCDEIVTVLWQNCGELVTILWWNIGDQWGICSIFWQLVILVAWGLS